MYNSYSTHVTEKQRLYFDCERYFNTRHLQNLLKSAQHGGTGKLLSRQERIRDETRLFIVRFYENDCTVKIQ